MIIEEKTRRIIPYCFIIIMGLLVSTPLMKGTVVEGHDVYFHIMRSIGTYNAWKDGQIIPLLDPNPLNGYGHSWNLFYGPITTYGVNILYYFLHSWEISINIFSILTILLSGIFMYHFAKEVFKDSNTGLVAALLYLTAPYHLITIFVRQAQGEFTCFIFFPLLFHGFYNLIHGDGRKSYLITVGASCLLLTHNLGTLISAFFVALYLLFNIKYVFKTNVILKLVANALATILLTLPITVPLLESRMYGDYLVFDNGFMHTTAQRMTLNAVELPRLLFNSFYKSEQISADLNSSSMPFALGFHFIIPLLYYPFIHRDIEHHQKRSTLQFLFLGLIATILTLNFIPWSIFPSIFYKLQFPWRYLLMSTLFFSLVAAKVIMVFVEKVCKNQVITFKHVFVVVAVIFLTTNEICAYATYKPNSVDIGFIDYQRTKTEEDGSIMLSPQGPRDYYPAKFNDNLKYISQRPFEPVALEGNMTTKDFIKDGTKTSFSIATEEKTLVELSYMFYVGYEVSFTDNMAGRKTIANFETKNGLLGFYMDANENGRIAVRYKGSEATRRSYRISAITLFFLTVYCLVYKRKMNTKNLGAHP